MISQNRTEIPNPRLRVHRNHSPREDSGAKNSPTAVASPESRRPVSRASRSAPIDGKVGKYANIRGWLTPGRAALDHVRRRAALGSRAFELGRPSAFPPAPAEVTAELASFVFEPPEFMWVVGWGVV